MLFQEINSVYNEESMVIEPGAIGLSAQKALGRNMGSLVGDYVGIHIRDYMQSQTEDMLSTIEASNLRYYVQCWYKIEIGQEMSESDFCSGLIGKTSKKRIRKVKSCEGNKMYLICPKQIAVKFPDRKSVSELRISRRSNTPVTDGATNNCVTSTSNEQLSAVLRITTAQHVMSLYSGSAFTVLRHSE